jgi:hypothetical protein
VNILETIVAQKKKEVAEKKANTSIDALMKNAGSNSYSLKDALSNSNSKGIIAEFKRKSPSKGWIHEHANVIDIVPAYETYGAAAASVLTDKNFFGGDLEDLTSARHHTKFPLLRKDFMIDEYQLIGVYNLEMARIYNYLLQQTGKAFTIIHGLDGYDEISLTNDTKVITNEGEQIRTPLELGKRFVEAEDIRGGATTEEAAKLFLNIIKGEGTWAQNAVVLANAAMALHCAGNYKTYDDAYEAAVESFESGSAYNCLQKLISLQ